MYATAVIKVQIKMIPVSYLRVILSCPQRLQVDVRELKCLLCEIPHIAQLPHTPSSIQPRFGLHTVSLTLAPVKKPCTSKFISVHTIFRLVV